MYKRIVLKNKGIKWVCAQMYTKKSVNFQRVWGLIPRVFVFIPSHFIKLLASNLLCKDNTVPNHMAFFFFGLSREKAFESFFRVFQSFCYELLILIIDWSHNKSSYFYLSDGYSAFSSYFIHPAKLQYTWHISSCINPSLVWNQFHYFFLLH